MAACSFISATIHAAPEITAALAWAPDMPPKPEVTNVIPAKSLSGGRFRCILAALSSVIVVPWTIPWGPMYM